MKKFLFCLVLLVSGASYADNAGKDLAAADALFAKKSYAEAMQIYTRLATAGNPDAQQHLGEMHLYGEAGVVDMAKAEGWFKKAAAKGNKVAICALDMMKKRVLRKDDIAYWVSKYDGAELRSGKYRCPVPRIPAMSKQNDEILAVTAKVEAWQECYNDFVRNLNASAPLTKLIPKEIEDLLTKDEAEQARVHLGEVYSRVAEDARVTAKLLLADFAVWRDATDAYVDEHNRMVKDNATTKARSKD